MRVGIIGGGQLGRMMALAGMPMGIEFSFLLGEKESDICVRNLGLCVRHNESDSYEEIYNKLDCPDVITIEHEHVSTTLLEGLGQFTELRPGLHAAKQLGNRISEKNLLSSLNVATSKYFTFHSYEEFAEKRSQLTMPMVVKASSGGYDGKSQYILKTNEDIEKLKEIIKPGEHHASGFIVEQFVNFIREVSFIGVRSVTGDVKFYSPAENIHYMSILVKSVAPAKNVTDDMLDEGHRFLKAIMDELDYVGVLAMECFEVQDNGQSHLLVNELAPRVHNSGHWTQAGSMTCQFENHVRAVIGLKLGSTENLGVSGMLNVLGKERIDINELDEGSTLHWYQKEQRTNRKMGHINLVYKNYDELEQVMTETQKRLQLVGSDC